MRVHKLNVTIPNDHQLEIAIRLPEDFPPGPAEVIVQADPSTERTLDGSRQAALTLVDELRSLQRTEEEENLLDEFDDFQREHPFRLTSLTE